jgi:hypothetical protein
VTVLTALLVGLLPTPGAQAWGNRALGALAHVAGALTVASGIHYGWLGRAQLGAAAREPLEPSQR